MVSYSAPKSWQQQQNDGGIQLSVADKKTGGYAIIVITKATSSAASGNENFNNDWNRLVKTSVQMNGEPVMQAPTNENGWDIISGGANYTDGGNTGMATLLTATGGGQSVSIVLMTNAKQYQNDLLAFINSVELTKITNTEQPNTSKTNTAIAGNWSYSVSERTYGALSPGYSTKQYNFKEDGTYIYQHKFFSSSMRVLLFQYESGTYSVSGNQLTISPQSGANEEWSQQSAHPDQWDKLVKKDKRKLEKVAYTFTLHYYSGINETNLILQASKPTEREGSFSTIPGYSNGWAFKPCNTNNNPVIIAPSGFKPGVENKPSASLTRPAATGNTINSPLAGKIWEAQSLEKHGAAYGGMSGMYTGGFWIYQYKFNADGTYHFVYSAASGLATNPVHVLQYETGTYAVNGSQLTITPLKGANEEWSVGKINNGMSAEHIREVLETRIKRLKTMARKLETITYPFTVEYWQGNEANALCLKHTKNTVREGSPGQNDQSCFFETTAAKSAIPPGTIK
ncbi:MAG: lipocalin family protein [Ferruginibacter sp.]